MRFISTKILLFFGVVILLLTSGSCDLFKKDSPKVDQFDKTGKLYSIEPRTTTVFWTGYKTTAKTPVKGQFTKLEILNIKKEKTARAAIDGLEFSIPVSSLFSNEATRDTKLKDFFFSVMDNTSSLTGTLQVVNDTLAQAELKMNGVSKTIPLTYFIDGQMLSMQGKLNVLDWNTQEALASLHKVCEEKHTGDDGISKTWEEVGVNIESYLKVE